MSKNCGRSARWNVKYHSIVSSLNIRHRSSGVHDLARSVSCLSLNERNGNYCDGDACIFQALRSSSEKVSLWRSYYSILINQRCSTTLKFPLPTHDTVFWIFGSVFAYSLSPGSCIGLACYNSLVVSSYGWGQATTGTRDFNWKSVALRLLSLDCDTVSMGGRYWRFGGTRYRVTYKNTRCRNKGSQYVSLSTWKAETSICHFVGLIQRFSNFFQVGTTFISQNVLRTTLTFGIIKLIRPALNSVRNMFLQQKIPLLLLRVE